MPPLTFEKALKKGTPGKMHLLLGNGFSRACRDDIFAYDSRSLTALPRAGRTRGGETSRASGHTRPAPGARVR